MTEAGTNLGAWAKGFSAKWANYQGQLPQMDVASTGIKLNSKTNYGPIQELHMSHVLGQNW